MVKKHNKSDIILRYYIQGTDTTGYGLSSWRHEVLSLRSNVANVGLKEYIEYYEKFLENLTVSEYHHHAFHRLR